MSDIPNHAIENVQSETETYFCNILQIIEINTKYVLTLFSPFQKDKSRIDRGL